MSSFPKKSSGFNRYEPPSPSTQGDENLEDAFLKDVDKFHDELPQPFRRVDKILSSIFEQAWICIVSNESENQYGDSAETNLETIVYEEEFLVSEQVNCIELVNDYVFVGSASSLVAYKVPEFNCFKCSGDEEIKDVSSLTILSSNENIVMLLVEYEQRGNLSVFGFKYNTFHHVSDIIHQKEEDSENDNDKTEICDINFSADGSFIALTLQGEQNTLAVYKLPIDEWMLRLAEMKSEEEIANENKEEEDGESREADQSSIPLETSSSQSSHVSFSKAVSILQLQSSVAKPNSHSLTATLRHVEQHGSNIIGNGDIHMLTSTYFENLQHEFSRLNTNCEEHLKIETKAKCHFLKGHQVYSLFPSHDNPEYEDYNAIGVWWSNKNQFLIYSLTSKDPKHALSTVLPHSDVIIESAVNETTDLIAVALKNRCVTLWNNCTGQPIKTFISDHVITMLRFSSVYHGVLHTRLTYATNKGQLWQLTFDQQHNVSNPVCLDSRCNSSTSCDQVIKYVNGPTNLLGIIWKSGQLIIYNEASVQPLCQLELFNADLMKATNGNKMDLKMNKKHVVALRDDGTGDKMQSRLFLFDPDQTSILQPFFHNFFDSGKDVALIGDHMERNFIKFLRKRKLSDHSLRARVSNHMREALKEDRMIAVQT